MKSKIPCEDCITLAICMKQLETIQYSKEESKKSIALIQLIIKCDIMKNYIQSLKKEDDNQTTV